KSIRHYIYCILFILANILLFSNTSFVFAIVMLALLFKPNGRHFLIVILVLTALFAPLVVYYSDEITQRYLLTFLSEENGFLGRYFAANNSLKANFEYVGKNFFIGFAIIDNTELTYTDSGYILMYLMGGPLLVLYIYICFYFFV